MLKKLSDAIYWGSQILYCLSITKVSTQSKYSMWSNKQAALYLSAKA